MLASMFTPNIWVYIVSYLHQHLAMLKFLIFANIGGQMLCYGLNLYSVITIESFYRCLLFCICFLWKGNAYWCSLTIFYWLFAFIFCICKFSLWNRILFLQMSVTILLHFKFLEKKDSTFFFIVMFSMVSIMIQFYSSLFCR